ncbi:MAG: hypothetical protein ACWGSD_17680 [Thermodesulfobacteriota bacterium]
MKRDILRANRLLAQQGIRWRISHEPQEDGSQRDIFIRNGAGKVIWKGFLLDAAIAWIIRSPIPDEDLEPHLGYEDESYVELLLFVPIRIPEA